MDFLVKNGDLVIENGDIRTATKDEADRMYIRRILNNAEGTFLLHPRLGAGLKKDVNSNLPTEQVKRRIRVNLKADGFKVHGIDKQDGKIAVNATRRNN